MESEPAAEFGVMKVILIDPGGCGDVAGKH